MPEMNFRVKWPNGKVQDCYSPSYVIEDYLHEGQSYALDDFVHRARTALTIASERVLAKYGFECSSALDQLRDIEQTESSIPAGERSGKVSVLSFTRHGARDARAKKAEHFTVVVVGGGQAGLSMSYLLKQRGVSHVVLEGKRIASAWRDERWDSFCLVTPNWQCRLPGHPYDGDDPQGFMGRDDIVAYVESYARRFELPVREGVWVKAVRRSHAARGFEIETSEGNLTAEQVVVATGGYHRPRTPRYAEDIALHQLHSSQYRNSDQLPPGDVLVVGTGQSGCQIAEDLHLLGRKVHLAVGSAPRCARRHRGKDVVEWLEAMGHYEVPIHEQNNPEELRERANHYVTGRAGGHDLDLRRFALEGMKLYGPALALEDGKLRFAPKLKQHLDRADDVYRSINRAIDKHIADHGISAPEEPEYQAVWEPSEEPAELDLATSGITSIVWATGFHTDFSWVKAPVFDERGKVAHLRGVTREPGLFFLGLPWLHTWGSGRFSGVKTDAEHLVEQMFAREPAAELGSSVTVAAV
ncbi:MAG: MSMEG_0569 family flavin-dependent oxidoreductase [Myxococcales bacterium]|nr:MAG: MSMEG_0569 family flavin-dependent oxidoreductase [Myxococcales bacterium]